MALADYTIETFPAALEDGSPDPRLAEIMRAGHAAFHQMDPVGVLSRRSAHDAADRATQITVAYRNSGTVDTAFRSRPHATLHHYVGTVNVGLARMLRGGFLTYAGVRPTDRRKGLLRELMTRNLQSMSEQQLPVAALIASEGGIYGRFGFYPVYRAAQLTLGKQPAFKLTEPAAQRVHSSGRVEEVTLSWLLPHIETISQLVHQQDRLSINRQAGYSLSLYSQTQTDQFDPNVRAAVHLGVKGRVDGFLTYRVLRGENGRQAQVIELVGTTPAAELALWEFVSNLDLVNAAVAPGQPLDSILLEAATDPRSVRFDEAEDYLWLRVLNPVEALQARAYTISAREAQMGLQFSVSDPLGYARGTFEVQLDPEGASVAEVDTANSSLELTERALSTLLFGDTSAHRLAGAGMIVGATADVLDYIDALFAQVGPARCTGDF